MTDGGKSDDNKVRPSWFFILLAIIISVLIAYGIGRLHGVEAQYRADMVPVDARAAAVDAVDLCKNAGAQLEPCLRRAIATAEKDGHDAQDLTAQQQAAWAGIANAVIGFLSTAGALLGLFWVKQTLHATRETLDEARQANNIADMSVRAWIGLEAIGNFKIIKRQNGVLQLKGNLKMTNYGNFPATNIVASIMVCSGFVEMKPREDKVLRGIESIDLENSPKDALPPGAVSLRDFSVNIKPIAEVPNLKGALTMHVLIAASYQTKGVEGQTMMRWKLPTVPAGDYRSGLFEIDGVPKVRSSRLA